MNNIAELPSAATSLAPRTLAEAMEFSKLVSQSGIVPKDYQGKPSNVLVAVQWGMELGLAPMQAMQNIAVINGRPSIWGDAMLAICQGHPEFEGMDEEVTEEGAKCTVKRRNRSPITQEFTKHDALTAGLLNKQGPWKQYPKRMMQMRARAFALRDAFADALKGIQMAEEVQDIPKERDMGDAQVVNSVDDLLGEKEQPKSEVTASPSKSDIDGCVKAFASIDVTTPMICAYASLQRVEDMSAEDLQKLRNAYVAITKNGKPLSDFFKVEKPEEDIDDAVMTVTEEQLVALINDADSIDSLDDIQALLDGLDNDEAKERVASMIGVRRSEFD